MLSTIWRVSGATREALIDADRRLAGRELALLTGEATVVECERCGELQRIAGGAGDPRAVGKSTTALFEPRTR